VQACLDTLRGLPKANLLDSGKHCGRSGPAHDRGVSSFAWYGARFFGGVGNLFGSLRKAGVFESGDPLNSDTSRPFDKPKSGRIAVKVINHLGDEVMKVFKIN
jgi:hypothetical protein